MHVADLPWHIVERMQHTASLAFAASVPVHLALAHGTSEFLARSVTSHAETTLWLLRQFFPLDCRMTAAGACTHLVLTRP